jgi:membrane protease YdiL (CAAX protease family)
MSEIESLASPPSKLASFFFHAKPSVAAIIIIMVLATTLIPGFGALIPILVTLVALLACLKAGCAKLLGLTRPVSWPKTLVLGAIIGIGLQMLFNVILDPLFELISGSQINLSNVDNVEGNFPIYAAWLGVGWVIGGFLEELSFRGYMITRIRYLIGKNAVGTTIAVLASAIPFGIAHMYQDWAGAISAAVMGACFAVVFIRSGYNLWMPILVHGFTNTTDLTLIYLGLERTFRLF